MTLDLHLRFSTRYGQTILVLGDHPALGGGDIAKAVAMRFLNDQCWHLSIDIASSKGKKSIHYKYLLQDADGRITEEWGMDRAISSEEVHGRLLAMDTWSHVDSLRAHHMSLAVNIGFQLCDSYLFKAARNAFWTLSRKRCGSRTSTSGP